MTSQQPPEGLREYRKTATIKAVQYFGQDIAGVCTGECIGSGWERETAPHIHGLEGDLTVSHGDWIATGVQGEHWAIKPDVFAASYVAVDPARSTSPAPDPKAVVLPTADGLRDKVAWHAVDLDQCSLFVDSPPLAKAMTEAATFLRSLLPTTPETPAQMVSRQAAEASCPVCHKPCNGTCLGRSDCPFSEEPSQ